MPKLVTIRHVFDPVEAEMLVDLLTQEGIRASAPGNQHSAMLGGLAASALRVPLMVPDHQADQAMKVLAALSEFDEVDPVDLPAMAPDLSVQGGEGPYRGGPTSEERPSPRKKRVAIAAALILPMTFGAFGAGHFYARSYARGFALLAAAWAAVLYALQGQPLAWFIPIGVVVADILGSLQVIRSAEK